jgi:tRNA(Ile2) C34 agmatinyltransferase TiaS
MDKKDIHKIILDYEKHNYPGHHWDIVQDSVKEKVLIYVESLEQPEEKNIDKCPFCESENLFDFWMHHYKCKDCNESFDV